MPCTPAEKRGAEADQLVPREDNVTAALARGQYDGVELSIKALEVIHGQRAVMELDGGEQRVVGANCSMGGKMK